MVSQEHILKLEEIDREIKSRGANWQTRKSFPIWLKKENSWGLIDLVGFKKEISEDSPAVIDAYEIENASGSLQRNRNLEKLNEIKELINPKIKIFTCQLTPEQNHQEVCQYFIRDFSKKIDCQKNSDGVCVSEIHPQKKENKKVKFGLPRGRIGLTW